MESAPNGTVGWYEVLMGINSIVDNCYQHTAAPIPGIQQCDDCAGAVYVIIIYLLFNCCYNVFIVLVIKHGSASLMYIVMTLRLPVVQLAFSLKFINNPPDRFPWTSVLGLIVILSGLVAYRWSSIDQKPKEGEEDVIGFVGATAFPVAIRRQITATLKRSGAQIRSVLHAKLGVIDTPKTPHSPRTRSPTTRSPSSAVGGPSRASGGSINSSYGSSARYSNEV